MNNFREVNDDILKEWLNFERKLLFIKCLRKIEFFR